MAVFVLNKQKNPLMPCLEKRARLLLECGQAAIVRRYPFTIWLRDRVGGETQPLRLKLNPGSRTTRSDGYAYFSQPAIALNKKETARQAA
ncbi:MAG: RRXRR domain-containing protein [Candidatus Thiodiazotropha sp.]|jgi:hypothetical protein